MPRKRTISKKRKELLAFSFFGTNTLPEKMTDEEIDRLIDIDEKSPSRLTDEDRAFENSILEKYGEDYADYEEDDIDYEQPLKPSKEKNLYWITAERKHGQYPDPTKQNGKWLVFVHINQVDELWAKIADATKKGKLGDESKVATARPNPNASDQNRKVICIYTYDWTDEKDVKRIRQELRKLGVTGKIPYKADTETLSGKYRVKGNQHFSKYYE